MYPRVKVKEQDNPTAVQGEPACYLLRLIESLSLENHCSSSVPVADHGSVQKSYSPPSCARISKCHDKNSLTPSLYSSKVTGKNHKDDDEHNKTNIRACSVPRPRAVLSSPDNDEMIGNQNRLIRGRTTLQKKHISSQNATAQCKVTQRNLTTESPAHTRKFSKKPGSNSHHLKEKHASELVPARQKVLSREG